MAKKCSVDGCERKHNSHGYCAMHLHRVERHGDPLKYERNRCGAMISNKKEYYSYRHMIQRCTNPKCKDYKDYGARGIKVCRRWQGPDGFANFLSDMGKRPDGRYSLDRINTNGDYEPDNCRWANDWVQANNQRRREINTRGVYENAYGRYIANIQKGDIRKTKHFDNLEDAISQRIHWEKELDIDIP